ncbi:MAG: hypothetical protein MUD17_14510, partial [Gemmatimonadaceae bacterium]|nr:hypothetical protein [Gemmatimonadaceae bacterium]
MRQRAQRGEQGQPIGAAHGEQRERIRRGHRLRRVEREDPPCLHEGNAITTAGLVHVRRRHEQTQAVVAQLPEQLPELRTRDGVNTGGGFVEDQQRRRMHECTAERELLLHPAGERAGTPLRKGRELPPDRVDDAHPLRDRGAEDARVEREVLRHTQILIQREASRHVAELSPHGSEIAHGIEAEHLRGTGVRNHQRRHHAKERGLAGTVRTDHAEELTR